MPVNKDDVDGAPPGASPRHQLLPWLLAKAVAMTPLLIVAFMMLGLVWGVGARLIYEAFEFGWDLFGF